MALLKDGTRIYGNAIVDGNIAVSNIYSGGNTWNFAADGSMTLPYGSPINFGPGNALIQAGMGFQVTSEQGVNLIAINTGTSVSYNWGFSTDGNLYLPNGSTVGIGTAAIPGGATVNTIELTPYDGGNPDQRLVIYPTAGDGNHVHLTSGNLAVTDLFLGDDTQFVKTNTDGSMAIGTNVGAYGVGGNIWTFGTDGTTTFPANTLHSKDNLTVQTSGIPATVTAITYSTGGWDGVSGVNVPTTGGTGSGLFVNVSEGGSGYADAVVVLTPGNGYSNGDLITATRGGASVQFTISILPAKNWTFGADGNLTLPTGGEIIFPDSSAQTTAFRGTGNIAFNGDTVYDILGPVITNAGPSTGATSGVQLPPNASTNPIQIGSTYGNIQLSPGQSTSQVTYNFTYSGMIFPDSTVQTTAYQVVRSAYNTQYPSVRINNAQFNINNSGNPTVGAIAGTWSGGYTATFQTAAGGSYVVYGVGSATATWTSIASYGFGVTFGAAGDRAVGLFSDDTNGHQYRVTWVAGSGGTGYGFIEVEQLI